MAKTKKYSSGKQMKMTWHFFVPGAVGGAIAFIFGSGLMLALEVFIVVVVATWIIGKYGPR
jgi:Flp pilus assembly protein TadB